MYNIVSPSLVRYSAVSGYNIPPRMALPTILCGIILVSATCEYHSHCHDIEHVMFMLLGTLMLQITTCLCKSNWPARRHWLRHSITHLQEHHGTGKSLVKVQLDVATYLASTISMDAIIHTSVYIITRFSDVYVASIPCALLSSALNYHPGFHLSVLMGFRWMPILNNT